MNSTDKTMNKEYTRQKGIAYLIFAVIAYLLFSFFIASLNVDIDWFSIVFVELYFLCFWLLCYLVKPNLKPNPLIVSYIIVLSIPLFFAVNYSQIYEIGSIDLNKDKVLVANADKTKNNIYTIDVTKCNSIKYKGKSSLLDFLSNPLICNEFKYQNYLGIEDDNIGDISFYGGRKFSKKYKRERNNILASEYFLVSYTKQDLHYPVTSLLFAMTSFRMEKNIIHSISFEHRNKYNHAYTALNEKFNQDYFQRIYQKQKDRYILFSLSFLINALAFSGVIYWVKRKYLNK